MFPVTLRTVLAIYVTIMLLVIKDRQQSICAILPCSQYFGDHYRSLDSPFMYYGSIDS